MVVLKLDMPKKLTREQKKKISSMADLLGSDTEGIEDRIRRLLGEGGKHFSSCHDKDSLGTAANGSPSTKPDISSSIFEGFPPIEILKNFLL